MIEWLKKLFGKTEQQEVEMDMLDMAEMITRLKMHEGCSLKPYKCPAGKLTIGIGRNVEDNPLTAEELRVIGDWKHGITREAAHYLCRNDIERCIADLQKHLKFFDGLDKERKYALIDLCFQLGINGLLKFKRTLGSIAVGNYNLASEQLLESKYASQVPTRSKRISKLIKNGKWEIYV